MTTADFLPKIKKWAISKGTEPDKWTIGNLTRNNGSFDDAALVGLLTEETEDVAGAFGARNVSLCN
jgi:hypothetical protein